MGYDAMCILLRLATNVQKKLKKNGIDLPVLKEFLSTTVTKFGKSFASTTSRKCRPEAQLFGMFETHSGCV